MPPFIWKTKENSRELFRYAAGSREESLKEKNRTWDPSDMAGLQELIKAKKELEDLGRKRQRTAYFFQLRIKYKHYMEV